MESMIQKELEKWESCLPDFDREISHADRSLGLQIKGEISKFVAEGSSLLEVGCGSGHLSMILGEDSQYKVSVLDFSEKIVDICKKNFNEANIMLHDHYVANMFEMSNQILENYDVVWNSGVLEHYNDSDIIKALNEMKRVSNKYVITLVPNSNCFLYNLWRKHITNQGEWKWGQEYAKSTMVPYFEAAGLRVLHETHCGQNFAEDYTYSLPGIDPLFRQLLESFAHDSELASSFGYLVLTIGVIDEEKQENPCFIDLSKEDDIVTNFTYKDISGSLISKLNRLQLEHNTQKKEFDDYFKDKEAFISNLKEYIHDKELYIAMLNGELNKLLSYKFKQFIVKGIRFSKRKIKGLIKKVLHIDHQLNNNPYSRINYLKEIPVDTYSDQINARPTVKCSLISTCLNEGSNIRTWLDSLKNQTLYPDEVIIVDGGSTDQTIQVLKDYIQDNRDLHIKLIESPSKISISKGRNIAIGAAQNEIIIATDFGTYLSDNFVQNITLPFSSDSTVDLAFCKYDVHSPNWKQKMFKKHFVPDWENLDLSAFIPSSRSIAFKKSIWSQVGGYPEWLTRTGEDTLYAIDYRRYSKKWAYCSNTIVYWEFPKTIKGILKMTYNYGKGDGENGLIGLWDYYPKFLLFKQLSQHHIKLLFHIFLPLNRQLGSRIAEKIVNYYKFKGVLETFGKRTELMKLRDQIKGNALILTCIPFYDSGGGQRGTQMSLELIEGKNKVTFVNIYPSYEDSRKIFFNTNYSLLELFTIDDFNLTDYIQNHKNMLEDTVVILEFPHPAFNKIIKQLKQECPQITVIYDCIDKWDTSLGGDWYSIKTENEIINSSELLFASAIDLKTNLEKRTSREVLYLPQGLNLRLFNRSGDYQKPIDLPNGEKIILYIGALWGDWFDWELLKKVCEQYPQYAIVCIGDYKGEAPFVINNLYFLGLKQQHQLPAYLSYSDVCIIPFKINELTQSVNPLKVYEYLAMGKPVVSTNLKEISNFPFVYTSTSTAEFIKNLSQAIRTEIDLDIIDDFVKQNSWRARIDQLMSYVNKKGTDNVIKK